MIRSDIIKLAKNLIMQGSIDPLWTDAEWSIFFDEAVAILHEALVDSETGFFEEHDFKIEPDENGKYPLPENFYSMIHVRDNLGTLEHLTEEEERDYGTTGYILVNNDLCIRNADGHLGTIYIDYFTFPKEMPMWEGGDDSGNSVDPDPSHFIPDPPLDTPRGARAIARIMQYIAQNKDGTMSDAVSSHISGVVDRFTYRLYKRTRQ